MNAKKAKKLRRDIREEGFDPLLDKPLINKETGQIVCGTDRRAYRRAKKVLMRKKAGK